MQGLHTLAEWGRGVPFFLSLQVLPRLYFPCGVQKRRKTADISVKTALQPLMKGVGGWGGGRPQSFMFLFPDQAGCCGVGGATAGAAPACN